MPTQEPRQDSDVGTDPLDISVGGSAPNGERDGSSVGGLDPLAIEKE